MALNRTRLTHEQVAFIERYYHRKEVRKVQPLAMLSKRGHITRDGFLRLSLLRNEFNHWMWAKPCVRSTSCVGDVLSVQAQYRYTVKLKRFMRIILKAQMEYIAKRGK